MNKEKSVDKAIKAAANALLSEFQPKPQQSPAERAIEDFYQATANFAFYHYYGEQREIAADILIAARLIFDPDELEIDD